MDYHVKIRILEENLLEKDKKLEQSLKHCLKLKMELAELRLNDQNNSKRINELIIERDKAINYVNIYIKTLHEFENKLKNNIEDKNCIINKLETDLKECNKLSNLKYNELKDNNEKLKSQIQKINESLFITQIRNKFLDIVLQQKDQIEAENKSIKEQIIQLNVKIQENKFELEEKNNKINLSQVELNKLSDENTKLKTKFIKLDKNFFLLEEQLKEKSKKLKLNEETFITHLKEKNQTQNEIDTMKSLVTNLDQKLEKSNDEYNLLKTDLCKIKEITNKRKN
jgi:chromosome segregation ATPase